jgi:TldD protein
MSADLIKNQFAEIVAALEQTVPYAAALYKKRSGLRVSVNAKQQSVEPEDPAEGAVFTLWNGQSFYEYATNKWAWKDLKVQLADFARAARDARDASKPLRELDAGVALERDFATPTVENPSDVSALTKLGRAKQRMEFAMASDTRMANAISILGDTLSEDVFVNRRKKLSQRITRVDAILVVFVTDGRKMADVHSGVSKNGGLEKAVISDSEIAHMVQDAKRLLDAERLKPGTYEVVTDPEWSGIIAHECFGHGMETDLYVRERALSQKYLGHPVASPIVNMFDDPSLIEEAGGFFFDDEGQPSTATHIIKDGVLQRGLTDLASAGALNMVRSANGRRESYARKAYARMTNTFFENGAHTPAQLIASVEDGLYLRHATNGM